MSKIFAADFLPHGVCMRWQSDVVWLHVVSDALITCAYISIPLLLFRLVRKRRDIPFSWVFLAFGAFIVACGATHAMSIVTLWNPLYRLDGVIKAITAAASITTAVCLARLLPSLVQLPSPAELREANAALTREIAERKEMADVLQSSRQELEDRVEERTRELAALNEALNRRIVEDKLAGDAERAREQRLRLVFDVAQIGTWSWDFVSGSVEWDGRLQTMYDLEADEGTKADDFFAAIHPDDRAGNHLAIARSREGIEEYNAEYRVVFRDGSIHWIGAQGSVLWSEGREPLGLTGFNIDITARKEAQLALEESNRQFHNLADSIPQLAWIAAADGSIFWYNQRWYEYTGTTFEMMQGWGWQSVHDPLILPGVLEKWRNSIQTGEAFSMEFPLRRGDGVFNWFLTRVTPVRDSQGRVARWFGTNTDVTEIRDAREALRESERKFRRISDSMPQMVWVTNAGGVTEWFNQGWYDYTGQPASVEKVRGAEQVHPEDREGVMQVWQRALADGTPYELRLRIRRYDGAYRWFLARATPFREDSGRILQWYGTCTDIDDSTKAQAEIKTLAAIQARLQAALDAASQVSIIVTDTAGLITAFNTGAERMLRYSAGEVVGLKSAADFHLESEFLERVGDPRDEAGGARARFGLVAGRALRGESHEREWTYLRKDGTTLDVNLGVTALRGGEGEISGLLLLPNDITRQKLLERELRSNLSRLAEETQRSEEANRAKSDFLASMSHEIRTPMNAILGMADLLGESKLDAEQRQYVEVFQRAGGNLLTLINNILDLSKIESGRFELERIEFKLDEMVDLTLELTGLKASRKGLSLRSRIAPDVPLTVVGDPTRLQQILLNLLGNAVKFTEQGDIAITVRKAASGLAGHLEFSVSDTGIGIPGDKIGSIFDDFAQADSSTTRKYGGTGLGLGICRRLVGLMGGTLGVESTPGAGSTFRFSAVLGIGGGGSRMVPAAPEDLVGLRVLVIDNNATNCLIFQETLTSFGLESKACWNAEEGWDALGQASIGGKPYSLVILDRMLLGSDGLMAVPGIRERSPGIPIILLTSDDRPGEATRCTQAGVSGYGVKPVKRSELLRLICQALGRTTGVSGSMGGVPAGREAEHDSSSLRILIAEDSQDNRLLIKAYLKQSPHEIVFAEDGELAVAEFRAAKFDLVVMDIQMPKLDGLGATRAIRAIERERGLAPTPIVALTANALAHDTDASRAAGCDAHISKPISKQKLLASIQEYGRPPRPDRNTGPILVEALEGLEEIVPEFLAARRRELPRLRELAGRGEFESLRKLAHDLKGTGSAYGFPGLTEIGAAMEESARASSADSVARQLGALSDYLGRVQLASRAK